MIEINEVDSKVHVKGPLKKQDDITKKIINTNLFNISLIKKEKREFFLELKPKKTNQDNVAYLKELICN